jgi:hypothetical protein
VDEMPLAGFQYPIVDSGLLFDFHLLEGFKEVVEGYPALRFRYRLTNPYRLRLQIPIHIAHAAWLNSGLEDTSAEDDSEQLFSNCVVDLGSGREMYGYGDDHYVVFEPGETREFLVRFEPAPMDFKTFDVEFFMKPADDEFGLYHLRYDVMGKRLVKRLCMKRYPGRQFRERE